VARAASSASAFCAASGLRGPLALADKGFAAARYLRRNPQWIVAAIVLLVVLRPRRALSWVRNGLIAWRAWRWISQSLRGLAIRKPA
jgi:hypothetical protein